MLTVASELIVFEMIETCVKEDSILFTVGSLVSSSVKINIFPHYFPPNN